MTSEQICEVLDSVLSVGGLAVGGVPLSLAADALLRAGIAALVLIKAVRAVASLASRGRPAKVEVQPDEVIAADPGPVTAAGSTIYEALRPGPDVKYNPATKVLHLNGFIVQFGESGVTLRRIVADPSYDPAKGYTGLEVLGVLDPSEVGVIAERARRLAAQVEDRDRQELNIRAAAKIVAAHYGANYGNPNHGPRYSA